MSKSKKNIGYYLSLNLATFQGKITSGFLMMGLLSVVLVIYPLLTYRHATLIYQHMLWNDRALQLHARTLSEQIYQSNYLLMNYLHTKRTYYKQERERVWVEEISPQIDSLLTTSKRQQSVEGVASLAYEAIVKAQRLKAEQDKLTQQFAQEQKAATEVAQAVESLTQDLQKSLSLSVQEQHKALERQAQEIDLMFDRLPWKFALLFLCIAILAVYVATHIILSIFSRIRSIKLKIKELEEGNLQTLMPKMPDELDTINRSLNNLSLALRSVKEFALQVGKGNLDEDLDIFDTQGELGNALIQMRQSLHQVSVEEQQRVWLSGGIAQLAKILREPTDLRSLCQQTLLFLANFVKAAQATLYIVQEKGKLQSQAAYAYDRLRQEEADSLREGEGLVGECFRENRLIYMTDLPPNYIKINSGLGESLPRCLLLVPLTTNQTVIGVIEMAFFQPLEKHQIDFLRNAAQEIGESIIAVQFNVKSSQLLKESEQRESFLAEKVKELELLKKTLEQKNIAIEHIKEDDKKRLDEALQSQKALLKKIIEKNDKQEATLKEQIKTLAERLTFYEKHYPQK